MYAYIIGDIKYIKNEKVIIESNNIGYNLEMSLLDARSLNLNENYKIYTEFVVRQDGVFLYGFTSLDSHAMFLSLTSVSSVGAKAALSLLSTLSVYEIKKAILTNEINELTKAAGVGRKTASRIILELSDKFDINDLEDIMESRTQVDHGVSYDFAIEALVNLGYSKAQASQALDKVYEPKLDLSNLVKLALKEI